jgi:septal ring factor EnvC (AmiA/AmiB activator)
MWQDDPLLSKLAFRQKQTRDNIEKFNKSLHVTQTMIAQNRAVIGAIQQSRTEGYDADQRLRELERETEALMQTSAKLSKDLVYSQGGEDEQRWLGGYLAP